MMLILVMLKLKLFLLVMVFMTKVDNHPLDNVGVEKFSNMNVKNITEAP